MASVIARFWGWIVRRLGAPTLILLALLLLALGSVALGLADLVLDLETNLLLAVAVSGALLGWVLAKSPLPGWLGGLMAFILGAEALLLHVGRLGRPLMTLLRSLSDLAWGVLRWPWRGPPDGAPVGPALTELGKEANTLLTHMRDWSPDADSDPLMMALLWGLALCMAAAWAGWAVRRRDWALQGIAPAGLLLMTALSYAEANHYSLPLMLGATWLLTAWVSLLARERRWQQTGTDFSLELRLDLAFIAGALSLALMMVAMLTPSISVQPIFGSVRRLMIERLGNRDKVAGSLGLEPGSGPPSPPVQPRSAGLPRRHLLGAGPELSQQVVMTVYPDAVWPAASPEQPQPRYYWRAFTYDTYTGRGWQTGPTETVEYKAGEPADTPTETPPRRTLRQKVHGIGDLKGRLYVSGELATADQDYRVVWRSPDDAFGAEIEATVYRADSLLPLASEAELRSAGSDYPDWVRDRYLALPDAVPERIFSLAHDLTATEPPPFDQARAIERHLRAFSYTLDLPSPPPGRDVADYFLFDLRQGYCDYYATSMAVLARAAGLPARMVIGYASGTYDATNERYVVTEADAHSWVEIYFPRYGWIEFEPTAGRLLIERPAEPSLTEIPEPPPALEPVVKRQVQTGWLVLLGLLGALVALALGNFYQVADTWRLHRMRPATTVATLYQRLYRHGRRLTAPMTAGSTLYEFEHALVGRVIELTRKRRWRDTPASITQKTRQLTDLYVQGLYSPRTPNAAEQTQAIQAWLQLRRQLWLAWLWRKRGK